jgi:putative addiction module component (TIGR02574 family)
MKTIAEIKSAIEKLSAQEQEKLLAELIVWSEVATERTASLREDADSTYHAVAQLEAAARNLSPAEREELCSRLANSLEAPLSVEEQAWADLAEKRAGELRTGHVAGIPADEVFAKARQKIGL